VPVSGRCKETVPLFQRSPCNGIGAGVPFLPIMFVLDSGLMKRVYLQPRRIRRKPVPPPSRLPRSLG
jgi:hypothetical protein